MITCKRCGKPAKQFFGSYFNSDHQCEECLKREEKHPLYPSAKKAVEYEEETGKSIWDDFPELVDLRDDEAPEELYLIPRKEEEEEFYPDADDYISPFYPRFREEETCYG